MSTVKKIEYPELEQWNIEAIQFGIQEPQKEDSDFEIKNDFYLFMVDFYNLLSQSPTKLFLIIFNFKNFLYAPQGITFKSSIFSIISCLALLHKLLSSNKPLVESLRHNGTMFISS